jgi:filamentous hemagglutinin
MTRTSAVRPSVRRPKVNPRRPQLALQILETREVPAHNLTIVAGTTDTNILIGPGNGPTVTIFTKGNDAQLSIGTLQAELKDSSVQHLIVTTDVKNGQAGSQAGNIVWDVGTAGSLDFTGFGTGKTLSFQTVSGTNAVGNMTLTGVQFNSNGDQISLDFDSSAANGDITFQSGAMGSVELHSSAVKDVSINAGTGTFSYTDSNNSTPADVGGSFTIAAGPVNVSLIDPITAQAPISVTADGDITLASGSALSGVGDLTLSATGMVSASNAALADSGGAISVSGTVVSLDQIGFTASNGLSVSGTTSVAATNGIFSVAGAVTFTGGSVTLTNINLPSFGTVGDVTVSGTTVNLANASITSDRDISVTGTDISTNGVTLSAGRNLSVAGPVSMTGFLDAEANGATSFTGAINGTADLTVSAGSTVTVGQNIGAVTPLNSLTLLQGDMEMGSHNISANQVTVSQSFNPLQATLGMNGTLAGTLSVFAKGTIAPGGSNAVGTLNVTGGVQLNGGTLAVDFGVGLSDQLLASSVTIGPNSRLGGGQGTGQAPPLAIVINTSPGAVFGTFQNAPPGVPVLVGNDAVTATYTTNQVILTPFVPAGGATSVAAGVDADGTGFKATLTGGGQVITGTDWQGQSFLVARNTTAASRLSIVTTANASSGVVEFPAGVLVSGPLAAFSAPSVNIGTQFRASGAVISATFRDFLNSDGATGAAFGGTPAQLTSITARNLFGSVKVGGTLTSLKVARVLGAITGVPFPETTAVSAAAIGRVTALSVATNFVAPGAIGTITVVQDIVGDVTGTSLASLSAGSLSGDVTTTGAVTSLKTTNAYNGTITAGSVGKFQSGGGSANIQSVGAVGSITGKGEVPFQLELSASSVGAIKVDGSLLGDGIANGPDWNVTVGITSLTAGSIAAVDVKAKFIGTIAVKGNSAIGLSGDISHSTFTLTGNNGTGSALTNLTAKGNVMNCRFDVQDGNVGAVTVGRFHHSQLYLNYTPGADFTLGSFGAKKHTLTSFKTTALPTIDPNLPLQWAFKDSEIAADTIGTVTLSGLKTNNGGTPFGIKFQTAVTSVIVMKADVTNAPNLPLGVALTPDKTPPYTALAGDFFFIKV